MAKHVIHISELEAQNNFAALLDRVRAGIDVIIEHNKQPVALVSAPVPTRRTIADCIALLPQDSTATIDADFAKDIQAAIDSHREPLDSSAWE